MSKRLLNSNSCPSITRLTILSTTIFTDSLHHSIQGHTKQIKTRILSSQISTMPIIRLLPLRTSLLRPSRAITTSLHQFRPYSSTFQPGPSPPRLPADQQAEFERLQRAVSDRINDPTPLPHEQQQQQASTSTPSPSPANTSRHASTPSASTAQAESATVKSSPVVKEDEVIPTSVRRGAKPEFEGDTNPKTGEVGGPKNEPLRWGSGGDWSYNGRVTDF